MNSYTYFGLLLLADGKLKIGKIVYEMEKLYFGKFYSTFHCLCLLLTQPSTLDMIGEIPNW